MAVGSCPVFQDVTTRGTSQGIAPGERSNPTENTTVGRRGLMKGDGETRAEGAEAGHFARRARPQRRPYGSVYTAPRMPYRAPMWTTASLPSPRRAAGQ